MGHKVKQSLMSSRIDFFYYAFRNVLLVSVVVLAVSAFVLGFRISHSSAIDGSGVDKVTLSIPVSCTLNATINSEHTISMISGTYKDNIGKTTMKTTCNDKDGYVIYAIGSTNDIDGKNTLSSIDLGEDYDIPTGLNTSKPSTGEDTSSWAMKLTPVAGSYTPTIPAEYNNTYGLIPNNWTNVASRDPGTFDMQEGSTFTTTYAIYTKGTQPAGTYTGQVKFALLHPSSSISPTTLERAFSLAGKTKVDIVDLTTGETNSYYKMQDMTTSICNTANITGEASQVQLVDIRDNKTYWATKLLDGHCWMTQNLDLDLDSSVALTSEDTDLNDTTSAAYQEGYSIENNVIKWTPNNSTLANANRANWRNNNNTPYSLNVGETYDTYIDNNHGLIGNYYNWTAAIASNNSTSLVDSTFNNTSNNPRNSICPKGWGLPIITEYSDYYSGDNDFANLKYYYHNSTVSPIWLNIPGLIVSGNTYQFNSIGYYQSSTLNGDRSAYYLRTTNNKMNPAGYYVYDIYDGNNRGFGFSIRCLAR